uniref:E3 ubiquitin-protein ligase MARCHF6 n=1 Tax=Salarias fasciatus TaxID=181472 RepID=A0A672H602_SALFA
MDTSDDVDICRVCRSEGSQDKPLYHPCVCTGTIKFVHQECLLLWLKHSRKEYCEVCSHRFAFTPIYSPDMPPRLPVQDIFVGLVISIGTALKYWLHYTLVAFAWLGVVPLTAYRIYKCLFTGSVSSLFTLPLDMLSTQDLLIDCLQGCVIVMCTLCSFISLVWLREQVIHGGAPHWLEQNQPPANEVSSGHVEGQLCLLCLILTDLVRVLQEHVFWVVSFNTLFILVFAFCPYHIGHFSVVGLGLEDYVSACEGEIHDIKVSSTKLTKLCLNQSLASLVKFQRSRWFLGVCYIVIKVSLLVFMELGLFPLICGWWLDICSLDMFNATLSNRKLSFDASPGTNLGLHWLVGVVYVFYFTSFILLLRQVLRPGVLWFLRNVSDPDFNLVQEMIHCPMHRHLWRFTLSVVFFGSQVLLMLWLPVRMVKTLFPTFLPYNVTIYSDSPVTELSLELLLLQVVLPALLEQGNTRHWVRHLIHAWTFTAAYMFDLHSYLLGGQNMEDDDNDEDEDDTDDEDEDDDDDDDEDGHVAVLGLDIIRQAVLQLDQPFNFQPYQRPANFPLKIVLLIIFLCATLVVTSFICITMPVFVGRWLISLWMGSATVHEMYTAASGLYVCWIAIRCTTGLVCWMPLGRSGLMFKFHEWEVMVVKTAVVAVLLVGVVPLLVGLLLELVIFVPLRVPLNQTPLFFLWQDWALGVLHTKIFGVMVLMGPQWWFKTAIEQVYANGIRNIDLHFILRRLAAPLLSVLLPSLCVPYAIAKGLVPLLGVEPEIQTLVERKIYPFMMLVVILLAVMYFQIRQFRRFYEDIKNDKYLIGQQLVNYERTSSRSICSTSS